MEIAQVKNAQAPRNKPHEVEEATGTLSITRKCFRHLALDYVLQVRAPVCQRQEERRIYSCSCSSAYVWQLNLMETAGGMTGQWEEEEEEGGIFIFG